MTRIGRAMSDGQGGHIFVTSGRLAGYEIGFPAGVVLNLFSHGDILVYTKAPEYLNWIYAGAYKARVHGEGTAAVIPKDWAVAHIGEEMLIKVSFTKHGIFLAPFRPAYLEALVDPEPVLTEKKADPAIEVLEVLNEERKKHFHRSSGYSPASKGNLKGIRARLKGNSKEDLIAVIRYKSKDWADSTMIKYLNPATLFRDDKFPVYLTEAGEAKNPASASDDTIWYECPCGNHVSLTRRNTDECPVCGEYGVEWRQRRGAYPGNMRKAQ